MSNPEYTKDFKKDKDTKAQIEILRWHRDLGRKCEEV